MREVLANSSRWRLIMEYTPVLDKSIDQEREPTWDIALLFPRQGQWSEEEYLSLPTNRLVEYSHGYIEVLPMATDIHQSIVAFLYELLLLFVRTHAPGKVLFAPLPIRLWNQKYREPDIVYLRSENLMRRHVQYWERPDLVIEVISPDYRRHDLVTKRREYAKTGIPEYWIIDPEEKAITVLMLQGEKYAVHGVFGEGQTATSILLPGFEVNVGEVWAAAEI